MRKLSLFVVLVLAGLFLLPTVIFAADSTYTSTATGKGGNIDYSSGGTIAVTDQLGGYTQHVDTTGAALVREKGKTIAQANGATLDTGTAMVSSACRVSSITVSGPTSSAADTVLIYDAASATGTAKFDVTIGTTGETIHLDFPGGAIFSTGVFADASANDLWITITYDN